MMVELDVEPVNSTIYNMFDGLAELKRWYSAPPLLIFSRFKRTKPKYGFLNIDLNPEKQELMEEDKIWINQGLKIIEERKRKDNRHLVYSSTT